MQHPNEFIDEAFAEYAKKVENYAEQYSEKVLRPFLAKHNLRFFAGMGSWAFLSMNDKVFNDWDFDRSPAFKKNTGGFIYTFARVSQ